MKQYIAFASNHNSGIKSSFEEAASWAQGILGDQMKQTRAYICEVTHVVERASPPINITPIAQTVTPVAKAA